MISLASSITAFIYKKVAKPLLFRFSPDSVHTGYYLFKQNYSKKVPPLLWLLRVCFAYNNESYLGQSINDVYYPNPVGLSAGFDKNFELLTFLPSLGFGFIEGGSLYA